GVPEFGAMGYVDGTPFVRYDSETGKKEPRADWITANVDRDYWDTESRISRANQRIYRANLAAL
ncbi:HMR1 protein, partial [Lophotis ruficrista]|nr:HMR1 protein [Lophotis ruficrista]